MTRLHTIALCLALTAGGCSNTAQPRDERRAFEVWLVDQSDSRGQAFGGTIHIFDGDDVSAANPSGMAAREQIDLSSTTASLCLASTAANPVRPHMLLFNRDHTHAILSFVASGHVVLFNAATRQPLACVRTSQSATGRQAHAAFPAPDGSFVIVANQNGKRLERIDTDFMANRFVQNAQATLDLATCTTPSGKPCQAPDTRPDNAPICPIIESSSRYAYVTLRGGGLFVIDARKTPMEIVAEYDVSTVKGNGCGGTQVNSSMFVNSGGRPGNLSHLSLYGFDVYEFPTSGFPASAPNLPAPRLVFSATGERDSHGMAATKDGQFLWVMDRHANVAEIISTSSRQRVNTVALSGALTTDPAPDLVDASPSGDRLFVALRGSSPLSGDPHIATGSTPGLGIIGVDPSGQDGRLLAVLRLSNMDGTGVERADAHAVRVRVK